MKKLMIGIIAGFVLGSAATLHAAGETVQAVIAALKFRVNGAEVPLKNNPLVVNGTSYLPVREVAELLGYKVEYDAETATVNLSVYRKDDNFMNNVEKSVNDILTNYILDNVDGVQEIMWNGMRAIQYKGKTYFNYQDFKEKFYNKSNPIESTTRIDLFMGVYTFYYNNEKITSFKETDTNYVVSYKKMMYFNTNLFPNQPAE